MTDNGTTSGAGERARQGTVIAVCTSEKKGTRKKNVGLADFKVGHGITGDAHAGPWHRQVSLLAEESIEKARARGLNVNPGDFAENLTTRGIGLVALPIGTRLLAGNQAMLEVTQIGKTCHSKCEIFRLAGDCVMPKEGIFARVLVSGQIKSGDLIKVDNSNRIAIVTVSDKISRGEREDKSAGVIRQIIEDMPDPLGKVVSYSVIPDERGLISTEITKLSDELAVDLIFTTGGTGLGPRDVTPEATLDVIDRQVPGFAEAMRLESLKYTRKAILSRGVSGIRRKTLIINLPGSPKGVKENLQSILPALPHGIETLRGLASECGGPA